MAKWTDKPWERQKGESEKAYEAFSVYRDLRAERTISAVVKQLGKSRSLIDRWKERWEWAERTRLYDNDLEKQARDKDVKDRKAMVDRQIRIAMKVQKKALEALETLSVDSMTPKDIKEFIKMATDLERLNRSFEEQRTAEARDRGTGGGLAEAIMAAYNRRKEDGDA